MVINQVWRLAVPWIVTALGLRRWIVDRLLHVPEVWLAAAAEAAGVTPSQWRRVEAVQAELLGGRSLAD